MKKILITIAFTTLVFSAKAQSSQKNSTPTLASDIAARTAAEDPHNPLVNGIPYDQYKAQVRAEQNQKVAAETQPKIQQQEFLEGQARANLSPDPTMAEKPKK